MDQIKIGNFIKELRKRLNARRVSWKIKYL